MCRYELVVHKGGKPFSNLRGKSRITSSMFCIPASIDAAYISEFNDLSGVNVSRLIDPKSGTWGSGHVHYPNAGASQSRSSLRIGVVSGTAIGSVMTDLRVTAI